MAVRTPLPEPEFLDLAATIEPLTGAFELLQDHVVITDPHGNIVYANPAVERHTGYSVREIMGKNPGDLWGGEMPESFYTAMWKTILGEKKPWVGEVQNKKKDGTMYWQELRITPVTSPMTHEVLFIIGIEPDITERKEREKAQEQHTGRLEFIHNLTTGGETTISALKEKIDRFNRILEPRGNE